MANYNFKQMAKKLVAADNTLSKMDVDSAVYESDLSYVFNQLRNFNAKGVLPSLLPQIKGSARLAKSIALFDEVGLARACIFTKLAALGFDTRLLIATAPFIKDVTLRNVIEDVEKGETRYFVLRLINNRKGGTKTLDGGFWKTIEEAHKEISSPFESQVVIVLPLNTILAHIFTKHIS